MKTDKELLELAAKACGLLKEYCGGEFTNFGVFLMPTPERPDFSKAGAEAIDEKPVELVKWNPLTDDGDALRLAVKLRLVVTVFSKNVEARRWSGADEELIGLFCRLEPQGDDPLSATRRAIVRVAAAIGESK